MFAIITTVSASSRQQGTTPLPHSEDTQEPCTEEVGKVSDHTSTQQGLLVTSPLSLSVPLPPSDPPTQKKEANRPQRCEVM